MLTLYLQRTHDGNRDDVDDDDEQQQSNTQQQQQRTKKKENLIIHLLCIAKYVLHLSTQQFPFDLLSHAQAHTHTYTTTPNTHTHSHTKSPTIHEKTSYNYHLMNSIHQAYNSSEICIKFSHSHFSSCGSWHCLSKQQYSVWKCFCQLCRKSLSQSCSSITWIEYIEYIIQLKYNLSSRLNKTLGPTSEPYQMGRMEDMYLVWFV